MKPLNRPMFRYGGPIKEGIMTGMKEKQAINTVGSPLAPKDETGRGGYALPLLGLGAAAMRFLPAAYRGFKAARTYKPMSETLGVGGRLKDIFMPRGGLKITGGKAGEGAGFRTGSFLRQNPLTALPIAGMAVEGGTKAATGLAKMTPDLLKQYANAVIPFADPFTVGEKLPETSKDTPKLEVVENIEEKTKTGTTGTGTGGPTKEDMDKDRIQKTKERYYKLMGIDKMNKKAAYDSLIDASRIVQEEGADLKGAIRSGNLQTRIINEIAKNLDKSSDLKKQIDAAILKGEIQKDIASADTLDRDYKRARIKALNRAEKQSGALGQIAKVMSEDGMITGAQTAAILRADGIKYDAVIQDKLFNDFKKDNPAKDERAFIAEKGAGLDDGLYVVGGKLVEKRGGKVAFAL